MLDVRRIRQNPQELRDMLQNRNKDAAIVDDFLARDEQRRKLMAADPAFAAYLKAVTEADVLVDMENRIVAPTSFSPSLTVSQI